MNIAGREIGPSHPPLVIAELGINHSGIMDRAIRMVRDAYSCGAEAVKFQCRIPDADLGPAARTIKPSNADETVWDLFNRCSFTEEQDRELKALCDSLGLIYLSTPYSRAGVDRLERLGVAAYKIGSGENRDLEFLRYVASKGKPMIISTGMMTNEEHDAAYRGMGRQVHDRAWMVCTSEYPTPFSSVKLNRVKEWAEDWYTVVGLSDHSGTIWPSLGAVALGASILEVHFTSDDMWSGPDIPVSITPPELRDLLTGARAIWEARGGSKEVLPGEADTRRWYEASRRGA